MKKKIATGIIVTMLLVTIILTAYPAEVSAQFVKPDVVIGLVGPQGWIQWDGIKEAAIMAKDLINDAGGMKDAGGNGHEVKLVEINEHAVPVPIPEAAVTELLTALTDNPDMETLIGGFRTECVLPMREACMDFAAAHGRPIWFIAGAATTEIIADIQTNYPRYKYMFRVTPMNSTALFMQILGMLVYNIQPKLAALYGEPVKTIIVAENLVWCDEMVANLEYLLPNGYPGWFPAGKFQMATSLRPSAVETSFASTFATINSENVKLVIHIFSAVAGAAFINYYGATDQKVVCYGINVESQEVDFYNKIGGNCEYESFLASVGSVQGREFAVNTLAKPWTTTKFWEEYEKAYGHGPIYTAWGTFDGIMAFNETAPQWIGKSIDERITITETTERAGMLGVFKYTGPNGKNHDMFCAPTMVSPYWPPAYHPDNPMLGRVRSWMPQWYKGEMEVVFPIAFAPKGVIPGDPPLPFARKYRIPTRMYGLAESDWVINGFVDAADMAPIQTYYGTVPPWDLLSGDMDNNNYFDIDDATRIALDWGKQVTLPLP